MPETIHVMKTLVIGLGTTGTQICDQIAARIRWEYGDVKKAPWVRFLCLETNTSGVSRSLDSSDSPALTITPNEYSALLRFDRAYEESIRLSKWADKRTLESIPKKSVDDGVGNIRMVGRLSLFFKRNYDLVRNAVTSRLNDLRQLTGPDAAAALGDLPDGSRPDVVFAGDQAIRIFVVGTLCGGTCSGMAGDFGFLLQSLTGEQERIISFFTLPHPDLSTADVAAAARMKKNAYTALVELNHYHLLAGVEKDDIPFPGHPFSTKGQQPYNLPFLAIPRTTGDASRREMERAIADRIFLNVFVPNTDADADAINVSVMDREGHAHVFCAFGLSTLEFPAHQVIDACSRTLLLKALREWKSRSLPESLYAARLREIGVSWPQIRERLLTTEGSSLAQRLQDQVVVVVDAAKAGEQELHGKIAALRNAFTGGMLTEAGAPLPANVVPQIVRANIVVAARQVYDNLRAYAGRYLLDYNEGPGRLRDLLAQAQGRLNDLSGQSLHDPQSEAAAVDEAEIRVNRSRKKSWLGKQTVDSAAIARLEQAMQAEITARLDYLALRALQGFREQEQVVQGVADRASKLLAPVLRRVDNLRTRVTDYQIRLEKEVRDLTRTQPEINGVALFNTDPVEGTVRKSYEECIEREKADPTDEWSTAETTLAGRVVQSWESLAESLFPNSELEGDWLREDYLIGSDVPPLPDSSLRPLLDSASQPFRRLRAVNVVERWKRWPNRDGEIERVSQMKQAFLEIDEAQAMRGGRSPIARRSVALLPRGGDPDLEAQIGARAGIDNYQTCPDPYRVVLIEEAYRFPLYAALDIVGGDRSLAAAKDTSFPTFHTRKDVYWTGLSEEEITRTLEAEELVVVGVLRKQLTMANGHLVMPWPRRYAGEAPEKYLPFSIRGAARALVFERADVNMPAVRAEGDGAPVEQELLGAFETLRDRIEQDRQAARAASSSDLELIKQLIADFETGTYNAIPDWIDGLLAAKIIERFCARNVDLYRAYVHVFPPDSALIKLMTKKQSEKRPIGSEYDRDGLYCIDPKCCGWIGADEADAARNGWRCYINPVEHDYSGHKR